VRRLEPNGTDQHPVIVFYGYVGRTAILIAALVAALETLNQYSGEVARTVRHSARAFKRPAMDCYYYLFLAIGGLGRTPPHGSAELFGASVVFEASL